MICSSVNRAFICPSFCWADSTQNWRSFRGAGQKQLTKAVAKAKAKARLRRAVVAIPIAGIGAITYFEEQDYQEWKEQNPEGDRKEYACEIASLTVEVMDDVLQGLPERVRPAPETVREFLPTCE